MKLSLGHAAALDVALDLTILHSYQQAIVARRPAPTFLAGAFGDASFLAEYDESQVSFVAGRRKEPPSRLYVDGLGNLVLSDKREVHHTSLAYMQARVYADTYYLDGSVAGHGGAAHPIYETAREWTIGGLPSFKRVMDGQNPYDGARGETRLGNHVYLLLLKRQAFAVDEVIDLVVDRRSGDIDDRFMVREAIDDMIMVGIADQYIVSKSGASAVAINPGLIEGKL